MWELFVTFFFLLSLALHVVDLPYFLSSLLMYATTPRPNPPPPILDSFQYHTRVDLLDIDLFVTPR